MSVTNSPNTSTTPSAQSPVQQVPPSAAAQATEQPGDAPAISALNPEWEQRLTNVLWQLGASPEAISLELDKVRGSELSTSEIEQLYAALTRDLALQHANDAWLPGTQAGQVPLPGHGPGQGKPMPPPGMPRMPPSKGPGAPPTQGPGLPPSQGPGLPPTQGPGLPPTQKPSSKPPVPTDPAPLPPNDPLPPGKTPDAGDRNLAPWLIGAGIVGAGIAGVVAMRTGSHNLRALRATAAAFESGMMPQGGLQSIHDAQLGARFAGGIGTREYLQVALPGLNRIGSGARLTSVARGHLSQTQLAAANTALRLGVGDAVAVHEPLRREVLTQLEAGRPIRSVLDELDRSAGGARPVFDNRQLTRYWDQTAIVERGPRTGGQHVTSAASVQRSQLAIDDGQIIETGRMTRVNQLVTGRGAQLGGMGLPEGIGSIQAANVSTLNPAMQLRAMQASGVDPALADAIGLRGAYMQRWQERFVSSAAGNGAGAP